MYIYILLYSYQISICIDVYRKYIPATYLIISYLLSFPMTSHQPRSTPRPPSAVLCKTSCALREMDGGGDRQTVATVHPNFDSRFFAFHMICVNIILILRYNV